MCVYVRAKFEVSSTILTSFRNGGNFTPQGKPSPKKPIQIRIMAKDSEFGEYFKRFL